MVQQDEMAAKRVLALPDGLWRMCAMGDNNSREIR